MALSHIDQFGTQRKRSPDGGTAEHVGGYLRAATDQRQLQNVTACLGPHGGLRGRHATVTTGYHLSKRHWNTVTLDGSVPDDEVLELIGHAYDLVVADQGSAERADHLTADPRPRSPGRDP
jgi:hypothetical protein